MRTMLILATLMLLPGPAYSGERGPFVGREVIGHLLDEDGDQISLVFRESMRERRPIETIALTRVERGRTTTLYLSRDDAERLIREVTPLVEWASRRQRFTRHIRLNGEVEAEAVFDHTMRLALRSTQTREEIIYTGAMAARMIEAVHEATLVDDDWMRDLFSRRPTPPPPPPPPPSTYRPGPPSRPERPDHRPDRGGESFTVDGIRVEPIGLKSWTEIFGRIRNHTNQGYRIAIFKITFLDKAEREVGTARFSVSDFGPGAVADFQCTSRDNFRIWKDCRVEATSLIK